MPRPSVAWPTDLEQADQHFASGVNHRGEIRGFALSGRHVGITFTTVRAALLAELEIYSGPGCLLRVFVDSGAFSEVEFDPAAGQFVTVKPITEEGWRKRFDLYKKIATWFRRRAYLVATDKVGDQVETLARLTRWALEIAACAALGAQIIVPVQKGALPMSEMFRRSCAILGLRETPIAGIPMMKDATSLEDLAELVASMPWYDCRIHLLGLGPRSPKFAPAIRCIKRLRPNAVITSDSVLIAAMSGRGGKKAQAKAKKLGKLAPKPRAYTRYQDEARTRGLTDVSEVKAYGLMKQGDDAYSESLDRAHAAGWFDTELYDTLEEALAHRAAGYPEPARETPVRTPVREPATARPTKARSSRPSRHQLALTLSMEAS